MGGILTPKNSKSTSSVNLPSYITDAYTNAVGQATSASNNNTPNYTGELTAGASPLQEQAYAGLPGAVNAANPYIDQAATQTGIGVAPTSMMQYSPEALGAYMNPYTNSVIDATQKQFDLQNKQQQRDVTGNAASNHALGGDRAAVAAAQTAGQQQAAQAPVIAGLNAANFQNAQNEFNTQQQTDLSNQNANSYRALYGAGEYGNLGQLAQGTQLAGLGAELSAGTQQQQTQQNADTAAYQDYYTKLGYPLQTAQTYASIISGLGSIYGGNKTTTTPGSSLLGQVAGLGLGAAGLGAFNSDPSSGPLGGSLFGGANNSFLGGIFKRGGEVDGFADGGEFDPDDSEESNDTAYDIGGDNDTEIADNALAGLAGAASSSPSMGGSALGPTKGNGGMGLDAQHYAMLAAGLGMMSAKGDPLSMIGQGGMTGLKAYQQQKQADAQMGYRKAMSDAATTRSQALAQHYENADKKPVLLKGKTFQWYYPSDNSYHDTHIDNPEFLTGQDRNKIAERNAASAEGRLKVDQQRAQTYDYTAHNPKAGAAGKGGVFGFKYDAAKHSGMSDADALAFAGGQKHMDDADATKFAMQQSTAQANAMNTAGQFEDADSYNTFRQKAFEDNLGILRSNIGNKGGAKPGIPAAKVPPKVGEVRNGFRFKGGDPGQQASWEKV